MGELAGFQVSASCSTRLELQWARGRGAERGAVAGQNGAGTLGEEKVGVAGRRWELESLPAWESAVIPERQSLTAGRALDWHWTWLNQEIHKSEITSGWNTNDISE